LSTGCIAGQALFREHIYIVQVKVAVGGAFLGFLHSPSFSTMIELDRLYGASI
jgi:hypothetical protein